MKTYYPYDLAINDKNVKNFMRVTDLSKPISYNTVVSHTRYISSKFGIPASQVEKMLQENYDYYQNEVIPNHPEWSEAEALAKQEKALQESVVHSVAEVKYEEVVETTEAKYYIWLTTESEHPRDGHLMLVGKKFSPEKGMPYRGGYIYPGSEYGCKCGFAIPD